MINLLIDNLYNYRPDNDVEPEPEPEPNEPEPEPLEPEPEPEPFEPEPNYLLLYQDITLKITQSNNTIFSY